MNINNIYLSIRQYKFSIAASFLFLTIVFSSASYAQTPQYYNYNTTVGSNAFPFGQTSGKEVQWLVLANEFNQPTPATTGRSITHLWFYMSSTGGATFTNLTIKLGQTAITTLPTGAFYTGALTTVYTRASVALSSTAATWMGITLDTPFPYDPAQSLVIDFGQCGAVLSGPMNVNQTTLTGNRRSWSAGGCPFVYSSQGATIVNCGISLSPLNGTYTIPGNYPTISSAVTALNAYGVSGVVTFNVAAGYTENITSQLTITTTGTSSNTITFQKSGPGANPKITRTDIGSNVTSIIGGLGDAVIRLDGSDYITFNGVDIAASLSDIEYGYFTYKPNATNGCQNVTIKNSTITMTKGTSAFVMGIYISNGPTLVSDATGVTVTATSGINQNVVLTGNTIQNVHNGIYAQGYSTSTYHDQNITIGAAGNGNTIQNFGGGSATVSYGVFLIYQTSPNIRYNTINNASGGSNATSTLYGIFMSTSSAAGDCYFNNNSFTLGQGSTSAANCIYDAQTGTSKTISNNTFSYGTFASTSASNLIYCSNATNNVTVSGNQTSGTINKTGVGTLYGYYNIGSPTGGTATITNNNFSNITLTGASSFYGIYHSTSTSQLANINYNTISYVTNNGASSLYCIYQSGGAAGSTISGNTISNLTGGGGIYGIYNGVSTAPISISINDNIINTLSNTGAYYIRGIYSYLGTAINLYRNKIYDFNSSSSSGILYGIQIATTTASSITNVYNNFISDFNVPTANHSTLYNTGIYISTSTSTVSVNLFYNTIFLNGTSSGSPFSSTCLYSNTGPTLDMRNNILINSSTPTGTGIASAFRRSSTTLTTYSSNSNNNCFYAGTPGPYRLLFYDGTNSYQTITEYKTLVSPRDASSFRENPPFVNVATTPYDLHLLATDTSQCESGGIRITSPIAITTDFESNTRFGETGYAGTGTAPDVGADEYNGIRDIYSPIITYTNLSNTTSTSNYTTSSWAYISDRSDININSGTSPRIYYKKNWHNNTYIDNTSLTNGWKWVESSSTTTPFDFTIDYSKLLGGIAATGDKIMYFVVAQDMVNTPNISINSGTFATQPSSVNLSSTAFPIGGTINSYTISSSAPLAGDYTVSLTLFNLITGKNLIPKEFTHKVIKEVVTDETIEKEFDKNDAAKNDDEGKKITTRKIEVEEKYFALSENGMEYEGSAYVEFTPEIRKQYNFPDSYSGNYANISSATRDINSAGIDASVRFLLLDANYGDSGTPEDFPITLNAITGANASKTVTIRPSSGITSTISGSSSTSIFKLYGADYITIDGSNSGGTDKSLTIQNTNTSASTAAVWLSSLGAGAGATYNTIKNCNIFCGSIINMTYAISLSASSTPGSGGADNDYNTIQNNSISKAYHALRLFGTSGGYLDGVVVTGNTIGSNTASNYITNFGIRANYLTGATISNNEIFNMISENSKYGMNFIYTNNSIISKNKIHGFNHSNTSTYYCIGLNFESTSTGNQLDNNLIYDLLNYGSTTDNYLLGLQISGGSGYKLYYNSISLTGAFRNTTSGVFSKCLYVSTASTNLDIKNNIFYNAMTGTSPKTYAIDIAASSTFASSNYNDFYSTGTVLGRYAASEVADISAWRTATSQDDYSVCGDPGFTSNTNLIPNPLNANSWVLSGNSIHLASVTTDITGANRPADVSAGAPDIGAYEFTASELSSTPNTFSITPTTGVNNVFVNGRKLISLNFTALGGISSIGVQFYSGVPPPRRDNYPTAQFMNGYFVVTPTGGSSFTYDITYFYSEPQRGTIVSEDNIRLSKNDGNLIWTAYTDLGTAPGQYQINTDLNTIDVFGLNSFSTFSNSDKDAPLPVQLASFTSSINGRDVILNWKTDKEINNAGFEIQRTEVRSQKPEEWTKVAFVTGNGTKNTPTNYSFEDKKLNTGKYNYRLKQIDYNGNFEYHNLSATVEIGIPKKFEISQNYPNPFNPVTKIDFDLPFDSKVSIRLYDITGREIKILVNETKQAGYYTTEFNGSKMSSGTYFYRIIAEGNGQKFVMTKKALLIK
jgi:hypothetical protein